MIAPTMTKVKTEAQIRNDFYTVIGKTNIEMHQILVARREAGMSRDDLLNLLRKYYVLTNPAIDKMLAKYADMRKTHISKVLKDGVFLYLKDVDLETIDMGKVRELLDGLKNSGG